MSGGVIFMHSNRDRELIIRNAISEYRLACAWHTESIPSDKIIHALNMMNNVFIMCSPYGTKGIDKLRKEILEGEKRWHIN